MKNDTLPATDHLKVFNREQEPPPVPPRQYPVHLPTVVVHIKGGAVAGTFANWPVRIIVCDGDNPGDEGSMAMHEIRDIGDVGITERFPWTNPEAQGLVAEVVHVSDQICHPAEAGSE